MKTKINHILFCAYLIFGQWCFWLVIWLFARFHLWRCLFIIYPHNLQEYQNVMPNWKWIKKYMSGRPVPGGIIWDGIRPIGIYFYISNQLKSLRKKKNRNIAKNIEKRMRRALQISHARSVGFAGQLGIVLEKRHDIAMAPPFYDSTKGNIYSLVATITNCNNEENSNN